MLQGLITVHKLFKNGIWTSHAGRCFINLRNKNTNTSTIRTEQPSSITNIYEYLRSVRLEIQDYKSIYIPCL